MPAVTKLPLLLLSVPFVFSTLFSQANAAGMVPETTLLVIEESTHSGVMNVKNTDSNPALLYTTVVDLPDDNGVKLDVTQPVVRVEAGQKQQLRFIMESTEPLTVEHYKRVTFEGIPPKSTDKGMKMGFNLRQDLPVLIRPKNLPVVTDAWNHNLLGTFSLGYYTYQATDNDNDSRSIMASWGKTFKYASITANWQHAVNQDDENHNDSNDDDMFYINISIPLGEQRVGAYMRNQGDKTTYGLQNNGSLSKDTHYYISADRDAKNQQNSFNGNLNSNLHYTQLSVGGGTDGDNYRNYNATFSGGIAAHEHGITFSPYTIKNTFAIARLSEPESGIEIATPQGRIWTDHWGQAVIPGLTEWRKSRVEVNANTLPKSMELANGIKNITVAHSAFRVLDFNVLNTRRVMLAVKRPDGSWLPKGTSIVDEKNNYLVSAVDSGRVFITDVGDNPALYAADDDMNRLCRIHYTLQKTQDKEAFYETAKGVCQ
ncbi:fimbria/pilus outer membrane usher protein [Salmonella enterica]|nr:hypothetical protein [Salmonella enterica]ECD6805781.1 hypothetical protein [Salmonella enterica subsp. enterica serovar Virchow]EAQ0354352.1 hypothetical protein [Salmonella enterica]EAQ0521771.1 hypothetical protein [Salmonella enterica]EAS1495474.1 hypothetical protein [Salmonella enterica]